MSSVLKQTLYPVSGRTALASVSNGAVTWTHTQTVAQTHDSNDTTYDQATVTPDGLAAALGNVGMIWTVGTCTYTGTIDKLRVRIRALVPEDDVAPMSTIQPRIGVYGEGTSVALEFAPSWHEFDFVVNPQSGVAWLAQNVNGQAWGWWAEIQSADEYTAVNVLAYEYELQVYGPGVFNQTTVGTELSVGLVVGEGAAVPSDVVSEGTALHLGGGVRFSRGPMSVYRIPEGPGGTEWMGCNLTVLM